MLHEFIRANRDTLIEMCRAKVSKRPVPRPTADELKFGIPLFLGQLVRRLEQVATPARRPLHSSIGFDTAGSEVVLSAAKHGEEMLNGGFTVGQVVHDYGDLCQAITELAEQRDAPIGPSEFKELNGCLDDAIASAVTDYHVRHGEKLSEDENHSMNERLGFLAHELRNHLNTAALAFTALKDGQVGAKGRTAGVIERSLKGIRRLVDQSLAQVRLTAGAFTPTETVRVVDFISGVEGMAVYEARDKGCEFTVAPVDPELFVAIDRSLLASALSNLLQNAFKFSKRHGHVSLKVSRVGDRVLIAVADECGGLPPGKPEGLFLPYRQQGQDRSGLGLGLSITQAAVVSNNGKLTVTDKPGIGCIFTIDLPRHSTPLGDKTTR